MKTSAIAAVSALCALSAAPAWASRPACQQPAFAVQAEDFSFRVDNNTDSAVLAKKVHNGYAGQNALGLTAVQSVVEVLVNDPPADTDKNGCSTPRLEVFLRYAPVRVYVAREFMPDSCPYKTILAHEMRHVSAYRQHLPQVQGAVREALERRFAAGGVPDPDTLQAEVDRDWIPFIRSEMQKVMQPQNLIDTVEEETRLSAACFGAVAVRFGARPGSGAVY